MHSRGNRGMSGLFGMLFFNAEDYKGRRGSQRDTYIFPSANLCDLCNPLRLKIRVSFHIHLPEVIEVLLKIGVTN